MAVAYIAYQRLTPATKAKVDALLKLNPDYGSWVAGIPEDQRPVVAFMRAALWADDIRNEPNLTDDGLVIDGKMDVYRPSGAPTNSQNIGYTDKFRHQYWHFHDTPLSGDGTPTRPAPTPSALTEIPILRQGLARGNQDVQAYDLVWLIHLIGDVHQPLHGVQRFTKLQPAGDSGGNDVKLCPTPECTYNLHSYWDGLFGTRLETDASMALGKRLLAGKAPKGASNLDSDQWIDESFELAKKYVYVAPIHNDGSASKTDAAYDAKAHEIGEQRVRLAGHRLANVINAALR